MTNSVGQLLPWPATVPTDLPGIQNVLQTITRIRMNDAVLWQALTNQTANVQASVPTNVPVVNTGTTNEIAYYAGAGTTLSALATADSGILVTSASGVPSIGTAIPNGVTATTQSAADNSTKVATTAYVNGTNGFTSQNVVTGSRALGSVYRNTTGKTMFVNVCLANTTTTNTFFAYSDSNSSPTTLVASAQAYTNLKVTASFPVLNGNYYELTSDNNSAYTITTWTEWY